MKGKLYKKVVRAAVLYDLETAGLTRKQAMELEIVELRMLRFSLGVTRLDRIRKEYIRGTAVTNPLYVMTACARHGVKPAVVKHCCYF